MDLGEEKSFEDDPISGCPVTANSEENFDHVHEMRLDDKRFTIKQIANTISPIP